MPNIQQDCNEDELWNQVTAKIRAARGEPNSVNKKQDALAAIAAYNACVTSKRGPMGLRRTVPHPTLEFLQGHVEGGRRRKTHRRRHSHKRSHSRKTMRRHHKRN